MVTPTQTDIERMAKELDIDLDSIFHFIVLDGDELIGEKIIIEPDSNLDVDTSDDHYLLVNPIKIIRDFIISDEDGSCHSTQYFTDWNPCSDGPYASINPKLVVSQTIPNDITLLAYLHSVYATYYPKNLTMEFVPDEHEEQLVGERLVSDKEIDIAFSGEDRSNVIDFSKYLRKKR